jgi:diaminohydroxyphosphoribosylaminopyrimidine deaminase/5-amino-6-(5-phosphoribosylamino)uracil reductase
LLPQIDRRLILSRMAPPLEIDTAFMHRAIQLAMRGRGTVEPNPMVGCVIVKQGQIIGEGFHHHYGEPHAEPNALANCREDPAGATAYVTLEPCCHSNKQTPPCVPTLIAARLARVVVGCLDPNPSVNGRGVEELREAGISVEMGVCSAECKQLGSLFFTRALLHRPYVTLKWAETRNGKIAGPGGKRLQITNAAATHAVHQLRAVCDSILVGAGTVKNDDPLLTARSVDAKRQPARYVLDRALSISPDAKIVTDMDALTTIFCAFSRESAYREKRKLLESYKVGITNITADGDGKLQLTEALERIADDCRHDLLVEPGPQLARGFFEQGLADRLWVIRSSSIEVELTAPGAPVIPPHFVPTAQIDLAGDLLTEYLNPDSPVFFAPLPSADFARVITKPDSF